jgi:glycosyltransferase involved in cell wall biosynthesis
MASLFVFPSYFEGFGLPPLEAMAVGTPVICSASTSLLEMFGNHALTTNPHDIGELAWAIERILADNTLSKSLSEEGQKYAQKFSWKKTAEKTLAVLHEVARED